MCRPSLRSGSALLPLAAAAFLIGAGTLFAQGPGAAPAPSTHGLSEPHDTADLYNALRDVINYGAELFNKQGDHPGCYRVYQGALISIRPFMAPAVRKRIDASITRAEALPVFSERAFELRRILDDIRAQAMPRKGGTPVAATPGTPSTASPVSLPTGNPRVEAPKVEAPKAELTPDLPKIVESAKTQNIEAPKVETSAPALPSPVTPKIESPKIESPKIETPAVAPKVEVPAVPSPKVELPAVKKPIEAPVGLPKSEAPKIDLPSIDAPKVDLPQVEAPKVEAPKVEAPKVEAPKGELPSTPKVDLPKVEAPKVETPKTDAKKVELPSTPKVDLPKVEAPKVDLPKTDLAFPIDLPKVEAPKVDAPKVELPKIEAPQEKKKVDAPAADLKIELPPPVPSLPPAVAVSKEKVDLPAPITLQVDAPKEKKAEEKPGKQKGELDGKVILDGKPLPPGFFVTLTSAEGKRYSTTVQKDGSFRFTMGVPVGTYRVAVEPVPGDVAKEQMIPGRYRDTATSGLTLQIAAGRQSHDLRLTN